MKVTLSRVWVATKIHIGGKMKVDFIEIVGFNDFYKCKDCVYNDVCFKKHKVSQMAFSAKLPVDKFCEDFSKSNSVKIKIDLANNAEYAIINKLKGEN